MPADLLHQLCQRCLDCIGPDLPSFSAATSDNCATGDYTVGLVAVAVSCAPASWTRQRITKAARLVIFIVDDPMLDGTPTCLT